VGIDSEYSRASCEPERIQGLWRLATALAGYHLHVNIMVDTNSVTRSECCTSTAYGSVLL